MEQFAQLSNREQEVVQHLLEGKSNKLIARELNVTDRTVEFHLKNIYSKFQVNSRMELVLKLKSDQNWVESEKLGDSTVAENSNFADNSNGSSLWNWVTSLKDAIVKKGKELIVKNSSGSNTSDKTIPVTFYESIRVCLTKYAEFNGRASRPEFWWFMLFVTLVASAFSLLSETASSIFLIAVLLPLLAAGSRRLRDSGKSAWWLLFLLAPVGGIVVLGFLWALPPANSSLEEGSLPA